MILNVKNLVLEFKGPDPKRVLNGISLSLRPKKLNCLVGHNGCGKTTLLNAICGIDGYEYMGSVSVGNIDLNGLSRCERAKYIFKLDQNLRDFLVPDFTVYEQLFLSQIAGSQRRASLFRSCRRNKNRQALINDLRHGDIELDCTGTMLIRQLSGGKQQQVALASLFLRKPRVALLDEPTANLDPENVGHYFMTLSKLLAQVDTTILAVTHNIPFVCKYADYVYVMRNGIIFAEMDNLHHTLDPQTLLERIGMTAIAGISAVAGA